MPREFFYQFIVIISGLDNIEARRYVNLLLHQMVTFEGDTPDPSTQRVYLDGGTEGFNGQCRVIIPYKTSCYECSLNDLGTDHTF